jgi:glycosyltransferase involved in cell wall biosynthesis
MNNSIRIYFLSPFCILRNSTNRIFDMRMCDAIREAGVPVTLVFPYIYQKENLKKNQLFTAYNTKNRFGLRMLYTPLTLKTPSLLRNIILTIAFFFASLRILLSHAGRLRSTLIISRDVIPLVPVILIKKVFGRLVPVKVIIQLHELKDKPLHRWVYRNCNGLMPNVPLAKNILIEKEKIAPEKIIVMNAPMVDFAPTDSSKESAREKINYAEAKPLIVYTGKVGTKVAEVDYILDAAAVLPQYRFIFTGGRQKAVDHFRKICEARKLENVTFTGFLDDVYSVRYYQLAADVLVSYYNTKDHMVDFNYPQKIQEYISTRNPVVTPDFGATREVINDQNAFIVQPDDASALAEGIRQAVENKTLANTKAAAAYDASRSLTFDARMKEFAVFFDGLK